MELLPNRKEAGIAALPWCVVHTCAARLPIEAPAAVRTIAKVESREALLRIATQMSNLDAKEPLVMLRRVAQTVRADLLLVKTTARATLMFAEWTVVMPNWEAAAPVALLQRVVQTVDRCYYRVERRWRRRLRHDIRRRREVWHRRGRHCCRLQRA